MEEQLLDTMDIERERGITIKSQGRARRHTADDGQEYQFNLIDTPSHVDFTWRSEPKPCRRARRGAFVVDATQGVEAQTVANAMMAMNADSRLFHSSTKSTFPRPSPSA